MMSTNTATQPRTMPMKTRSPQAPPRERARNARGRGSPSAAPPPVTLCSIDSARGQERLALVGDLPDLGLDLLDDSCRQRRVEQVRGIPLAFVGRPPQEAHQRLTLGLVGLILVDQQPGEARDRIRSLARRVGQRDPE